MSDVAYILLFLSIGGLLAALCTRATVREWRTGRALAGKWGDYSREKSPAAFWTVMFGNAFAAVVGYLFLVVGSVGLGAYLGWLE